MAARAKCGPESPCGHGGSLGTNGFTEPYHRHVPYLLRLVNNSTSRMPAYSKLGRLRCHLVVHVNSLLRQYRFSRNLRVFFCWGGFVLDPVTLRASPSMRFFAHVSCHHGLIRAVMTICLIVIPAIGELEFASCGLRWIWDRTLNHVFCASAA